MDETYRLLIDDFIEEAQPLAERLAEAYLEVERLWNSGEPVMEVLPEIKSDLHTLKGNSGLMGLIPIQALTHSMEDICVFLAENPDAGSTDLADLLLEASDRLLELIRQSRTRQLEEDASGEVLQRLGDWIDVARKGGEQAQARSARNPGTSGSAARERRGPGRSMDTVRINFHKLDGLLEMVGEAMVSRSMLHEAQRRILPSADDTAAISQLDRSMQSLDMALKRLQEGLVETRLLPVSRVFRRFTRQVRDQALDLGKSVNLVTVGSETTIDKAIIDKLGDPLLHLVRNSVAHGIEDPKERKRLGKTADATIELRAEQLSDRVVISVRDDGRGLDEKKIRSRAGKMGYDTDRLSATELYSLIFQPGFSTADGVSTFSGRGVGLDVVASTIETIGGSISVSSEAGRGAVFRLDLPLTLAVVKALFVEMHGETYALPLSYVEESFRIDPEAIHLVEGRPALSWRGEMIRLVDGGDLIGAAGGSSQEFCVVISAGRERCGLRAGRLLGHRDVVVKGLENSIGQQELLSGVTITGDGRVVFILDAARITGGTFGGAVPVRLRKSGAGREIRA